MGYSGRRIRIRNRNNINIAKYSKYVTEVIIGTVCVL